MNTGATPERLNDKIVMRIERAPGRNRAHDLPNYQNPGETRYYGCWAVTEPRRQRYSARSSR
jgi:hypothetical protein